MGKKGTHPRRGEKRKNMELKELASIVVFDIDMDGTLARWNEKATLEEVASNGYFRNLDPTSFVSLPLWLEGVGFEVRIRSAVYQDNHSAADKEAWLKKYGLGELPRDFIPYGTPKSKSMRYDGKIHILIDDHTPNLVDWENNVYFGTGVKFMNHVNGKHGRWQGRRISEEMTAMQMFAELLTIAYGEAMKMNEIKLNISRKKEEVA